MNPGKLNTKQIGDLFLTHYRKYGYKIIPGSSLLDDSVPMSFVMSAGMVQFERLSGNRQDGDRFCLIQNCFRYFDLDRIGDSQTHLSLFQMPGAFFFGEVDRQEAIAWLLDLLVGQYGIRPDSLAATYFAGDVIDGEEVPADIASEKAWRLMGLPPERIYGLSATYNFWSQTKQAVGINNSQKRGPNAELFFDRGATYSHSHACFPGCPCGRYVEFANILFITHRLDPQTHCLIPLEDPFTEVVIGLERAAMIIQGKELVFEIDSLAPLIRQVRAFSKPMQLAIHDLQPGRLENILVDHLRALLFLVADGAPAPGKGGRARLVRILMREMFTCQRLLGISDLGFLRSMIWMTADLHPSVQRAEQRLLETAEIELDTFEHTIQAGMRDLRFLTGQIVSDAHLQKVRETRGLPIPLLKYQLWRQSFKEH